MGRLFFTRFFARKAKVGPKEYRSVAMFENNLYRKYVKGKIRRWHVELLLLGFIIAPMILMILWVGEESATAFHNDSVRKALVSIAAGTIGLGIWILGASVIVINLLKEILAELQKTNKR